MGRAGYSEDGDFDNWSHIRWRGQVASATKGKRGQAFFREMAEALDAMPDKRLISGEVEKDGDVCAIGSVGLRRHMEMSWLDPDDPWAIADAFGIASPLVREIEFMNDEAGWHKETPEARWSRMRSWVESQIVETSKEEARGAAA